jgi:putative sterol carrier protein
MAHDLFSHDWVGAWRQAIQASEELRAKNGWRWPLVLVARGVGRIEERAVFLDLCDGECREARVATAQDLEQVPYILAAELRIWKRLMERALEPLAGIMKGQLKLVRGSVASLLPYASAAKELVAAAIRVETSFPEGI